MHIPKIVLTGGPCGGKTTAKAFLSEKLLELGYYPIFVPEGATMVFSAGLMPDQTSCSLRTFQEGVIDMIVALEGQFEALARQIHHKKPVLICDRGIMDSLAYMPAQMFHDILRERGLNFSSARDARYLGVFHLRSAAIGAEEFYTLGNNVTRKETVEQARALDEATLATWIGHPHVAVIGNEGRTFEQKLNLLWAKLCRVLGEPVPLEIERKYLVRAVDFSRIPHSVTSDITQMYICPKVGDGSELRIRRRGTGGVFTYYETIKRELRVGVRAETERLIGRREYELLAEHQLPNTHVIEKKRHCFVYNNQYFELDVFDPSGPHSGLLLLEIELTEERDSVEIPPWIDVALDVTGKKEYTNFALASAP